MAAGNREISRVHREVTERIRIVRRLDFTRAERIEATYNEHGAILEAIGSREAALAGQRLRQHIEHSRQAVHRITLHALQAARSRQGLRTG
jgi:DNA-binding FadR family transcriptional regulator